MSLSIDIEESITYRAYVRCDRCDESHEGGEWRDTRAGAHTSACDAAKADGWVVTGNSAVCRVCDNYDPTPYETGEPDNLPREAQERAAESMRMKR